MSREPDKYNISAGQRKVTEFLSKLGLVVDSEVPIGPYHADIYLPELKIVVEVDGPWMHHSALQHSRRDDGLKEFGVKEVIHVSSLSKEALEELKSKVGANG